MLPVFSDNTPLCFFERFSDNPHAYVKLWKHHGAQAEADEINRFAEKTGKRWLGNYGGKVSSEWMHPKLLETLRRAPEVFDEADAFIEAGDFVCRLLTGENRRSVSFAAYKALWNAEDGFPEDEFFTVLDPRLSGVYDSKLSREVLPVDSVFGYINEKGSALTGLPEGVAVACPVIDAHAALPALKVTGEGTLALVLGTSGVQMINSAKRLEIGGIGGLAKNAVVPGLYTYEAGQACFGDAFDWFAKNLVPAAYEEEARKSGMGIHEFLTEKAKRLEIGESGLVALDWFGGNRSTLNNADLSGLILGLTLTTSPEEIYRAVIEAAVFGARAIMENYENGGFEIREITAGGGISRKNPFIMQMFSDVCGKPINISASKNETCLGTAIFASVAAGIYPDIAVAAQKLGKVRSEVYLPNFENTVKYNRLYSEYIRLYEYFGNGELMKRLKNLQKQTL